MVTNLYVLSLPLMITHSREERKIKAVGHDESTVFASDILEKKDVISRHE